MNTTITIGDAGLMLIGIALLVLIVYCIVFVRNLIPVVKSANKILEDTQIISGIAAENAQNVNKIISDVSASLGSVSDIIKGNQSIVTALASIVNAIGSIKNLLKKSEKK